MLVDVPKLYGKDSDKVILRMNSVRSHAARIVYEWFDEREIKHFTKDEWLANSPEVSSMDFFGNGHSKNRLAKRQYRTMERIMAAAKEA